MEDKSSSFSIKNWSEQDQPRERLVNNGKELLSDAELLAILIGSGNREESAVGLSKRILKSVDGNLNNLGKLSLSRLMKFKGVGTAKAVTIIAALELGRRRREETSEDLSVIQSSKDVFSLMQPVLGELAHEEFWILYLNNSNKVMQQFQLSKGGITGTLVDIRLVIKKALELGAVALVLVHNHPSGTLKVSVADKEITAKLKNAAQSLDLKVLDHVIVTERNYYSFADEGIL